MLGQQHFDKIDGTRQPYRSPVDHKMRISGTFAELRADHYHMGIDIRSEKGVGGDKLFAIADGFVSRIRVSAFGYGNALYIDHPNGVRSVYAHLKSYPKAIQQYIDSVHYARERFELDLPLTPDVFPVAAGDFIGKMGNTGSSRGAHLHFELRRTSDDAAFNPLLNDFGAVDTRPPSIRGLTFYEQLAGGGIRQIERVQKVAGEAPSYYVKDTVRVWPGKLALGLKSYDHQQGTHNRNGIYRAEVLVNQRPIWVASYDTIRYEDTRYVQANYDYLAKRSGQGYYYRLHRLPNDQLEVYDYMPQDGFFTMQPNEVVSVEVRAYDSFGNCSTVTYQIKADEQPHPLPENSFNYLLRAGENQEVNYGRFKLSIPADALYYDTHFSIQKQATESTTGLSECIQFGDPNEPIQQAIKMQVDLSGIPVEDRSKIYLAPCGKNSTKEDPVFGTLATGSSHLEVYLETWGNYQLKLDTVAPKIVRLDNYTFRISDDVSSRKKLFYRVEQGGKWILAPYDAKSGRLRVRKDKLTPGRIRVQVWDQAGNVSTL